MAIDDNRRGGVLPALIVGLCQDGADESAPFSPTSTPIKRIRVVSTFEFELR